MIAAAPGPCRETVGEAPAAEDPPPPLTPLLPSRRALSMIGLVLIAFGTGGIKPCVSAFGGDQFEEGQVRTPALQGPRG